MTSTYALPRLKRVARLMTMCWLGGVSASGFMATVEAYNPLTDRWSSAL